eukprot:CAMPEP_0194213444 /NCGR_PEP_ID=MMETSP0156-20130528/14052_1 /TAXON_ID=33649 /ORGANISM="Thalassionema nitzschioides, Strain L26-B" /LENGTH=360 /DNA_ID=CAMNT_0038941473 /DNA_START=29 /DNA_END=1111 /DNA_ORIENTATION=+
MDITDTKEKMDEFKGVLVGMGQAALEIHAKVGQDVFDKYEIKSDPVKFEAEEKHESLVEELIKDHDPQLVAGGPTQNTIRVAQWMLRKGGQTAFVGTNSDDDNGDLLEECTKSAGVFPYYFKIDGKPTCTHACLTKDDDHVSIINPGTAEVFNPEDMTEESCCRVMRQAKYYYMEGYMLPVSLEAIVTVGRHALENEKLIVMNFSDPGIVKNNNSELASALGYSKYIIGHEDELEALRERLSFGDNVRECVQKLADLPGRWGGKRIIICTRGSNSTLVSIEGADVFEVEVEPLSDGEIVDMHGAGAAFAGGFLSQLVRERSVIDCVKAGHWAARAMIMTSGTQLPDECSFRPVFGPPLPP